MSFCRHFSILDFCSSHCFFSTYDLILFSILYPILRTENVLNYYASLVKLVKEMNCVRKRARREKRSPNADPLPSTTVTATEIETGTEKEMIVTITGDRTRKERKDGETDEGEMTRGRERRKVEKKI